MRHIGSSMVDPYTAVSGAAAALYGPLHGGAVSSNHPSGYICSIYISNESFFAICRMKLSFVCSRKLERWKTCQNSWKMFATWALSEYCLEDGNQPDFQNIYIILGNSVRRSFLVLDIEYTKTTIPERKSSPRLRKKFLKLPGGNRWSRSAVAFRSGVFVHNR